MQIQGIEIDLRLDYRCGPLRVTNLSSGRQARPPTSPAGRRGPSASVGAGRLGEHRIGLAAQGVTGDVIGPVAPPDLRPCSRTIPSSR